MADNVVKWFIMSGNGWKWFEMAENGDDNVTMTMMIMIMKNQMGLFYDSFDCLFSLTRPGQS